MGEVGVCADWSPFHCTVVLGGPEVIEYWRRYYEGQDGIVSVWGSVGVRGGRCEGWCECEGWCRCEGWWV